MLFGVLIGTLVRINKDSDSVMKALNLGNLGSMRPGSFQLLPGGLECPETMQFVRNGVSKEMTTMNVFYAIIVGLIVHLVVSMVTECSAWGPSVDSIVQKSSRPRHQSNTSRSWPWAWKAPCWSR